MNINKSSKTVQNDRLPFEVIAVNSPVRYHNLKAPVPLFLSLHLV